ncbi:MAG TPA: hypothetical protein VHZ24_20335 [Pirellulales bacterium]|jgi:hypothetical protein|nr:hypothetical protein [Pirellulales bacterium]
MAQHHLASSTLADGLAALHQLLDLLAALKQISDPLTSAAGLHEAITVLLQVATTAGANPDALAAISRVLNEEVVFNVVLAVVQYLASLLSGGSTTSGTAPTS